MNVEPLPLSDAGLDDRSLLPTRRHKLQQLFRSVKRNTQTFNHPAGWPSKWDSNTGTSIHQVNALLLSPINVLCIKWNVAICPLWSCPTAKPLLCTFLTFPWHVNHFARLGSKVLRFQHSGTHWWPALVNQKKWSKSGLSNWIECLA